MGTIDTLEFSVIAGDEVTLSLWREASNLFSSEYGYYSAAAPQRAGQPIRMGVRYYQAAYASTDYRVVFCRDGGKLVAQAIYRELETDRGRVAFVVQLVVERNYRKRGIASTLLHAVWGFTDYYAWGIVTSNAFTVETLEAATFRRVSPSLISERADWLRRSLLEKISFLAAAPWRIGPSLSCIASNFYTDRTGQTERAKCVSERLGEQKEGEEWIAVSFRDQVPDVFSSYQSVISDDPKSAAALFALMPSRMMWTDGEFFNPNCVLIDRKRGLVCHKEQFPASDVSLPGEYLIRDRRFCVEEIVSWAEECGLNVASHRFVRAGFRNEYSAQDGKEILLITRKQG